jgi:hypothetical protein
MLSGKKGEKKEHRALWKTFDEECEELKAKVVNSAEPPETVPGRLCRIVC